MNARLRAGIGALLFLLGPGGTAPRLDAASDTWVGNTSANWNADNWTGGNSPPQGGDALFFGVAGSSGATLNNNFASGTSFSGITFNSGASAYTMAANWTRLTGGITNNSSSLQVLNLGHELSASVRFDAASGGLQFGVNNTINLNGNTLTVTGAYNTAISLAVWGTGANSKLVKDGAGLLTMSGGGSWAGATTVNGGTLQLAKQSANANSSWATPAIAVGSATLQFGSHDNFGKGGYPFDASAPYRLGCASTILW